MIKNFHIIILIISIFAVFQIFHNYIETIYTGFHIEDFIHKHKRPTVPITLNDFLFLPKEREDILESEATHTVSFDKHISYMLDISEVERVQVVYAKPTFKDFTEIFGHFFFRVQFCNQSEPCKSEYNDLAFDVSIQDYNSETFSFFKVIGFFYRAQLNSHKLDEFSARYLDNGRDLLVFPLDLESSDRIELVSYLLKNNSKDIGVWNSLYLGCNYYLQQILLQFVPQLKNARPFYSLWGTSTIELFDLLLKDLNINEVYKIKSSNKVYSKHKG